MGNTADVGPEIGSRAAKDANIQRDMVFMMLVVRRAILSISLVLGGPLGGISSCKENDGISGLQSRLGPKDGCSARLWGSLGLALLGTRLVQAVFSVLGL